MNIDSGCLLCGASIEYSTRGQPVRCEYCGTKATDRAACQHGHWICDDCHGRSAVEIISAYCLASSSTSPQSMARQLLRHPVIHLHGPEHHFLVPAILLTAYYNALNEPAKKGAAIAEAQRRASQVPGGFCGFQGTCGAAVGTGIFMSLITQATPLSGQEWRLANLATANSLQVIGEVGGPRCCKRTVMLALDAATAFLKARFNVSLESTPGVCEHRHLNQECIGSSCPYHPIES